MGNLENILRELSLLQLGVFDAVANFNGGRTASILIYECMNYTLFWGVMGINKSRLRASKYDSSEPTRKNREKLDA